MNALGGYDVGHVLQAEEIGEYIAVRRCVMAWRIEVLYECITLSISCLRSEVMELSRGGCII